MSVGSIILLLLTIGFTLLPSKSKRAVLGQQVPDGDAVAADGEEFSSEEPFAEGYVEDYAPSEGEVLPDSSSGEMPYFTYEDTTADSILRADSSVAENAVPVDAPADEPTASAFDLRQAVIGQVILTRCNV